MLSGVFAPRLLSRDRSTASSVSLNCDSEATMRRTPFAPTRASNVTPPRTFRVRVVNAASADAASDGRRRSWNVRSIDTYVSEVAAGRLPVAASELLTADQEIELAKRIEKGDMAAKRHMVEANLRLVVSIAKGYLGRPADIMLAKDGSILVADDWAGAVYRISYKK